MHAGSARRLPAIAMAGLLALSLGACTTASGSRVTGSTGGSLLDAMASVSPTASPQARSAPRTTEEWRREAEAAAPRYRANPRDADAALRYAEALRRSGQRAPATAVLQQASISNPNDKRVAGAYGRALADAGDLKQAMDFLGRAHTPDQPDWRILSAQGAVLDQMGRHDEARRYYSAALRIAPEEPSVLSNLGLSYALSRDLAQAESTLRRANANGAEDRRVRQNLALVVGLQGRFQEAEQIARADLPPEEAAANIAYLRQMLAEQRGGGRPARDRGRSPAA